MGRLKKCLPLQWFLLVEFTARVLDQFLTAYHALSDLSEFQASIHENGGILLGTWKELVGPFEKALVDEIVDIFGDEVEDHGQP